MKKFYSVIIVLTLVLIATFEAAQAVPAYPHPVEYKLPDGTTITITLKGDEKVRWAETRDGYSVLLNKDGFYEYCILNEKGDMVRSGIRAFNEDQRTNQQKSMLSGVSKKLGFSSSQVSMMKQMWQISEKESSKAFPTTGSRKLICILIGYTDKAFTKTQTDFNNLYNQIGYSAGGATGSVKDYYLENSYNQFNLTVDVAGPYAASQNMAYYGANDGSGNDLRPRELVAEAINLADPTVNFATYDNDGDTWVDGVYIIYAGYGEEAGGGANCIWAHAWQLASAVTKDGVKLQRYSCSAELSGSSGTALTNIGVICHEFGHVLGAPDYYDTDYATGGQYDGTSEWDMMAGGSWNNNGATPAHHNGFTKVVYYNWATATELTTGTTITLNNAAQNSNSFYKINTNTSGEYYFIENREKHLFDAYIPGSGMMIYHVHKDVLSSGSSNDINNTHPQQMYPVAQNATSATPTSTASTYGTIDASTCPWTGTGKTEFTDASTPCMKSWAGVNTNKPITNILRNGTAKTVTFDFMGGAGDNPTNFATSAVSSSQINLTWTRNSSRDVLLVFNSTSTIGTPTNGTSYSAGNAIPGGGTVLYAGSAESYSHTGLTAQTTYYYKIFTKINSTPNWSTGIADNETTPCNASTLPLTQDFNASTSLPGCWSNVDNQGNGQVWQFGTHASGLTGSTGNYAYLNSDAYGSGNTQNADLVSPLLDLSAYTSVTLAFNHYFRSYTGSSGTLSYSINGGSSWTQIQQWTTTSANPATFSQDIAAVAGQASVKFKWNYTGSYAYYWDIDNVSITGSSSSPDPEPTNHPSTLAAGTTTATSITLTWTDATAKAQAPSGYLIKGSTVSYAAITTPVDGTPESDATLVKNVAQGVQTVTFSSLTAGTTYYFKIFPYTNSGATIDYKTDGTVVQASGATLSGGSPVTIFTETMGTVSSTTTISTHESNNGFDNDSYTMTQGGATNPGDIRTSSASSGYTGASGAANVWLTSTNAAYGFAIEGIDASTYTSLKVQFGYRKESASALPTLAVDYYNGSSYINVPFTFNEASNASAGWYLSPEITLPAGAQIANLRLRWVKSGTVAARLDDIKLVGTPSSSPPTITLSTATLSGFTYTEGAGPSAAQSFTVSGSDLTANITLTAPTNYEISQTEGSGYTSPITLTQSGGTVGNTTIYVRLKAGLSATTYNGETITAASTDATSKTVTCSGEVTAAGGSPTISVSVASLNFEKVYSGYYSRPQKYTVTGSDLTADITVAAPTGIEVTTTCGSGYGSSVTLTQSGGSVNATVYARYTGGTVASNITHASTGATTQNIAINETASSTNLPGGYYSAATGTGATLKTSLKNIITTGHSAVSYASLWTHFVATDSRPDGSVWDIYTDDPCGSPCSFVFGAPDQDGSTPGDGQTGTAECELYNREHSFPASWFNDATPTYTDMFHLMPTDKYVNNQRSSYCYGEVTSGTTYNNGGKLGTNTYAGAPSNTCYEPSDEYKGDIARNYFYIATRYESDIDAWEALDINTAGAADDWHKDALNGTEYPCFDTWFINMLLEWHTNDPVDQKEKARNDAIYTIQGNRNPFIDNPSYVDAIWGDQPTITISTATLTGFTYVEGAGPSTAQSFTVSGSNLTANISLTAPTNYEISQTEGSGYTSPITLTQSGGTVNNTTIYVRLKAGLSAATYNGETITAASTDATSQTVTCSGEVTAAGGGGTCGTETFTSIPTTSSSSYSSRSWTGDDGSTWNATQARTDQTINGKAICLQNSGNPYIESGTISGGCGEITFKHQQKFSGSGGEIIGVYVGVTNYLSSNIAVSTTETLATISNINVSGNVVIKIVTNGASRIAIDDVSWTCYSSSAPTIVVSETSLTGFTYIVGNGPSAEQTFNVSGTNLTANISLVPPTNYEISTASGGSFSATNPITLTQSGGTVNSTPVYVRMKAGLDIGSYNGETITASSTGADDKTVTCSGSVPQPTITVSVTELTNFTYTEGGGPSTEKTFTVAGSNLSHNISIAPPTNYEISTGSGGSFVATNPITLTQTGGTVSTTTIYVRLKAGLSIGTYNSEVITASSTNATDKTVTCSGSVTGSISSDIVAVASSESATVSSIENTTGPLASTDGVQVWQFTIRDGGESGDGDALPTIVTGITITQDAENAFNVWTDILSADLFDGSTHLATATITVNQLQFTGVPIISVSDNGSKTLSLRISLSSSKLDSQNPDGDDLVFQISQANVTTQASGSSGFAAFTAAASTNGQNVLEVVATELKYVQQPTDVTLNTNISPAVTVEATDVNGNRDLGFTETIKVTGSGATMMGGLATASASAGIATFSSIQFSTVGAVVTLNAERNVTGDWDVVSDAFEVFDGPCLVEGFDNGTTAPDGWTFTSIGGTYTTSGNFGLSSPSLQMNATGDRVETPTISNASELSFWIKGQGATGSYLLAEGYDGADWLSIDNILLTSVTTGTTKTYNDASTPALPAGLSKFRFTYTRSAGNLSFDDVTVYCVGSSCVAPTAQSTDLSFSNIAGTSMRLDWVRGDGEYVLVVAKQGSAVTAVPTDNTTYTGDTDFGLGYEIGTNEFVVFAGDATNVTVGNLSANTVYHFAIYEYNCEGGNEKYLLPDSLTGNQGTINYIGTSAIAGSPFCITATESANVTVGFVYETAGSYPAGGSCTFTAQLSNGSGSFASPTTLGTVVSDASGSQSISGVIPAGTVSGTGYRIRVVSNSPAITGTDNGTDLVLVLGPENVVSNAPDEADAQITLSWANPISCFNEILVVAKEGAEVTAIPSGDGSTYTADASFGAGYEIETDEFVVYKGTGTTITITELTNDQTYHFTIFTRKGTEWSSGVEVSATAMATTTLEYGDLAILAVNTSQPTGDEISFVAFKTIVTGTAIDFTDNGYGRENLGKWGDTEGVLRFTRMGANIPAGTVITFVGQNGSVLGTHFNIYVGGVNDNANWTLASLNGSFQFNMNASDQVWIMQGGDWVNGGSHNDDYTGNILYGWTATGWKDHIGTIEPKWDTEGSMKPAAAECSITDLTGMSNKDKAKYTGPTTAATKIEWIGRFNDGDNWTSYASNAAFDAGLPQYKSAGATIPIESGTLDIGRWAGYKSTDWCDCSNWRDLRVPTSTINVVISDDADNVVTLTDAEGTCASLTLESNTTTLTLAGTAVLNIVNNFNISTGITFEQTAGTIKIKRNFNNSGTFTATGGTIEFNGTTRQTVDFPVEPVFHNLTINNTNGVTIEDNAQVKNLLTMTKGDLFNSGYELTIGEDATSVGDILRTAGRVYGKIIRWIPASTTAEMVFPVGKSGMVNPAYIEFTGAPTTGGTLTAELITTLPNNYYGNLPMTADGISVDVLPVQGFWRINAGDGLSGGTYTVTLDPGSIQVINVPANIRILKRENPMTDDASNYSGTWANGSNQGSGFGNWNLWDDGSNAGHFLGSSTVEGHADINTLGTSFGMYGHTGEYSNAEREITSWGDGYSFNVDMAVQWRDASKGINLYDGGSQIWNFNISDAGYGSTGWSYYSDMVLKFKATQSGTNVKIQVIGESLTGPFTDTADYTVAGTLSKFRIYTGGGSNSAGQRNLYFNNLSISKPWTYNGTFAYTDGLFVQSGMSGFSEFSLAGNSSENPLPIELLYFNATKLFEHVQLQWATASECNNHFFTVERSADLKAWGIVGNVDGAGNSSTVNTYSLMDTRPMANTIYYRLKQTDFNGRFKYSEIVSVNNNQIGENSLELYPNPNNGLLMVAGVTSSAQVTVYDVVGQLVIVEQLQPDQNTVDLSQQPNGIYFVTVIMNEHKTTRKIILSK